MANSSTGRLYIVATPIGNLKDITFRAVEVLRKVDGVIAEDTRRSRKLLDHYDIESPFTQSYYQGAEQRANQLLNRIEDGQDLALISDAGTPLISDPGFELVRGARQRDITVVSVPGPTAAIAGLVLSGQPTDSFIFDGMVPRKETQKRKYFQSLTTEHRTTIIYESPHRVAKTLKIIGQILPDRSLTVCRELTKEHEEIISGKAGDIIPKLEGRDKIRGEITIVLRGATEEEISRHKQQQFEGLSLSRQFEALQEIYGLSRKEALQKLSDLRGLSRNKLYEKLFED